MAVRGIRGATTADANTREDILSRTKELLDSIIERNRIEIADIASVIFSVTGDLDAGYPAVAAREMGWRFVPLFCTMEMAVPGSLARCIRVLMHVNTEKRQNELSHVYLNGAKKLRPDLE
jgi:chorismate mutase